MTILDGKVAIISGAGRGIGRGIAMALAKEGATIAIAELDESAARDVAQEIADLGTGVLVSRCDVRSSAEVTEFVSQVVGRFGTVDVLVNNAMAAQVGVGIEDLTDDGIELALATGPKATLFFMRACFPYLQGGGRVINLRSPSEFQAPSGYGAYIAAKSAIGGLTRAAAREWGGHGITVNAIAPLALGEVAVAFLDSRPGRLDSVLGSLSIARNGDAELDIGRAAVFLAGPDAGFITGCTLTVDGGGVFVA